jgi:hypothetical protein
LFPWIASLAKLSAKTRTESKDPGFIESKFLKKSNDLCSDIQLISAVTMPLASNNAKITRGVP